MKRSLVVLMGYVLIFAGIFFISFYDLKNSIPIVEIGMKTANVNLVVMGFSFFGLLIGTYHIVIFEKKAIA